MREFTPWLGLCHLQQVADDSSDSQPTLVAVWTDSTAGFEREVHVHTNVHSLQMIWAERVMPADEWLAKHPDRKDAQRLAAAVSETHLVEVGTFGAGPTGVAASGKPDGTTESYLHIKEIEGVEPLDSQFGVHPPKTVPDALYEPLFGQPELTREDFSVSGRYPSVIGPMRVYAILDVGRVNFLLNYIEESSCTYRCLFQGRAAEEFRETAPYIVELDLQKDFTRTLFSISGMPRDLWEKDAGILIRSRASIDQLRKHFRKFTRVQVETDKRWVYFRFWEPKMIPYFLRGTVQDNLEAFFNCSFELHTFDDAGKWQKITLENRPSEILSSTVLMKPQDFKSFRLYVYMRFFYQLKQWIIENFKNPNNIENIDGFIGSEIQFAINTFRTEDKRIITHYTVASWLLGENAFNSERIDQNGVRTNAGGAKRLYDRAFQYCYMIEGESA